MKTIHEEDGLRQNGDKLGGGGDGKKGLVVVFSGAVHETRTELRNRSKKKLS